MVVRIFRMGLCRTSGLMMYPDTPDMGPDSPGGGVRIFRIRIRMVRIWLKKFPTFLFNLCFMHSSMVDCFVIKIMGLI